MKVEMENEEHVNISLNNENQEIHEIVLVICE